MLGDIVVFGMMVALPVVMVGTLYMFFARLRQHRLARLRWLRLVVGNALVLLLVLSLIVLAGEVYYRFLYDITEASPLTRASARWFERYYILNNWGVRDNVDYENAIEPGHRRVTIIGDSFTVGQGVRDVEDRFANIVRRKRPAWEVHVLAGNGRQIEHHVDNPHLADPSYDIDVVVMAFFLNDVSDRNDELTRFIQEVVDTRPKPGYVVRHSFLLDQLYWSWLEGTIDSTQYRELMLRGYQGEVWREQTGRLVAFRGMIRGRGGTLCVITFPFLDEPWESYSFTLAHQRLGELWGRLEVPHVDLFGSYGAYDPIELVVSARDTHPNELAHSLAAEALLELLDEVMAE